MKRYKWYNYLAGLIGMFAYWYIVYDSKEEFNPVMFTLYSFLMFGWTTMLTKIRVSFDG